VRRLGACLVAAGFAVGAVPGAESGGQTVLFKNATIWTMAKHNASGVPEGGILTGADLLIRDGKIAEAGKGLSAPSSAQVVDAQGMVITPGIIDCHSHTAVDGDVNEGSNNVTSEVRIQDVLDPTDIAIYRELAGGTTIANVLHGSANSIGGQTQVIKLRWGSSAAALPMKEALPGIKFALGENPKQANFTRDAGPRYPATRMGVEAAIRKAFLEARDYAREKAAYQSLPPGERERRVPPRRDLQKEALVEVMEGKRLVHCHSYRQDEILMMIRLAEEFGFQIATFQHVLEGYKVADEMARHGAGASTFSDWWAYKFEVYDAIPWNGTLMARRGVVVSFNSDSDELARRLNLEAAKAVKYGGLGEEEALAFVTINPAKQLRIDKYVGSIEAGKDADLAVWNGHPLSTYTACQQTWVDGVKLFDRAEDLAGREAKAATRAALIAKIAGDQKSGAGDAAKASDAAPVAAAVPAAAAAASVASKYHYPAAAGPTRAIALTGATIHPVSGPEIAGGTILIRGGKIEAVGTGLKIPSDAETIRLDGQRIYPGMLEPHSILGLTEIGAVRATNDFNETGSMNADERAETSVNPDSELIPVARANGITHVVVAPQGGLVSGTSALIRLQGWTFEDMTAATPVGMHVQFPDFFRATRIEDLGSTARDDQKKAREKSLKELKEALAAARAYGLAAKAHPEGGKPASGRGSDADAPDADPILAALLPVVEGREPVFVKARDARQITAALDWAHDESLRIVIVGGDEALEVAARLKATDTPVIIGPVLALPRRRDDPYDAEYSLAARLNDAGVRFCFSAGGDGFAASNGRNLPYHAAMAAAYGLPHDAALRAVTLSPAEILGVADALGSIEPGKSASLMVTSGDPLEIRTQVTRVFIDGVPADMTNRQTRLYDKYRGRPKAGL